MTQNYVSVGLLQNYVSGSKGLRKLLAYLHYTYINTGIKNLLFKRRKNKKKYNFHCLGIRE